MLLHTGNTIVYINCTRPTVGKTPPRANMPCSKHYGLMALGLLYLLCVTRQIGHMQNRQTTKTVSYTHLRAHETDSYLVCRLLLEKKKKPPEAMILRTP